MRFSKNGPDIPDELIDASIKGEVVFLCGAGVSQSSGLPNFKTLTERIFDRLAENMTPAEQQPFAKDRFEETLGALARRLVDKRSIYRAVADELDADRADDLSPHETILRLSRDFESRPVVITTNFDTLFERALNADTGQPVESQSFAGAQIPAPGGARFEGIIHLHGRLADHRLSLTESDLVLTSADYGDAYLRSGWASRFLFDLARSKIIVLVGYSASDPPVRYILNILEADRERFPEIKAVFALDTHQKGAADSVVAAWEAIAVVAIPYELTDEGFAPLWRDLATWAELAERPRGWRKSRFEQITSKPVAALEVWESAQAAWLLKHDDVVALLPTSATKPDWLGLLRSQNDMKLSANAEWPLAQWAATHLQDPDAFRQMLRFRNDLGPATAGIIDRGLSEARDTPLADNLQQAWRLLAIALRQPKREDHWHHHIALGRIRARNPTSADLEAAIGHYVPSLFIRGPRSYELEMGRQGLATLCCVELEPERHADTAELLSAVGSDFPQTWQLLNAASEGLLRGLMRARDAGQIDRVTHDVPSIGEHRQNEHHDGFLHITRLCAELWLRVRKVAPDQAHAMSELWKQSGYSLTTRLWLFSLLRSPTANADHVVDKLVTLPRDDFWAHRKELLELLRDRCSGAKTDKIIALSEKILEGPELQGDRDGADRQRGLDSTRWLYLKALIVGNTQLPNTAKAEFDAINSRRNWTNRPFEEQDLFWIWSYGATYGPHGDPTPIAEADPIKRIKIATELEQRDPFNQSDAWRVYCKQDPSGALDAAITADPAAAQADRWRDVLWGIQDVGKDSDDARERCRAMCKRVFAHLEESPNANLEKLISDLVDVYQFALNIDADVDDAWWDRLWALSDTDDSELAAVEADRDPGYALISTAINRPAGKLITMVINRLGPGFTAKNDAYKLQTKNRLQQAIARNDLGGLYAMAEITRYVAWLHAFVPELLDDALTSRLTANTSEAEALRSILVGMAPHVNQELRAKLKSAIIAGVRQHRAGNGTFENAASRIVAYVRDDLSRAPDDPDRLRPREAKRLLSEAHEHLRADAADIMADWLKGEKGRPAHQLWREVFSKMFEVLWPAGKQHQSDRASIPLAKLALAAGEAFPEAWSAVRPYVLSLNEDWPTFYFLANEDAQPVIDRYPQVVLDMLWTLLKPATRGQSHELEKVLERLANAEPALRRDRRYQMLETRVMRL
ncbi:MAG: SIR2 family protein [Hyphomicrobiaceae bacterium]